MKLMKIPRSTHQSTKHLDVRYFYTRDLELEGTIKMEWLSTKHMVADLLTKPLQEVLFIALSEEAEYCVIKYFIYYAYYSISIHFYGVCLCVDSGE